MTGITWGVGRDSFVGAMHKGYAENIKVLREARDALLAEQLRFELEGASPETLFELDSWLASVEAQHRNMVKMEAEFTARYGGEHE